MPDPKTEPQIVELRSERASLLLAPEAGGRLMRWSVDDHEVIRWPDDVDWAQVARVRGGNPLLFPFIGRHRVDGEIGKWRDATGVVRALGVHGFARELPFASQIDADAQGIAMTLRDGPTTHEAYPFAFTLTARYRLDGTSLLAELLIHNSGQAPLPCYPGHHFYFALPHALRGETTLTLPAAMRRRQAEDGLITPPEPGEIRYRLDDPRLQDTFHVLAADARGPRVTLETPALGRTITLDIDAPGATPWYAVTTWSERPDADFYCVEPWLGLPDAIHQGLGLRMVAPGATLRAACTLDARFAAAATAA
jgi:galactose mutarotase-like enzyme